MVVKLGRSVPEVYPNRDSLYKVPQLGKEILR